MNTRLLEGDGAYRSNSAIFGMLGKHPVEQSRNAVDTLTTWLSIANSALVIDLLASSGLMVACKSKRCSGKSAQ